MSVEIRIIGTPEDVAEAEAALKGRFKIHSMRHYKSKYGDDRRSYIRASVNEPESEPESAADLTVPLNLANLHVKLQDLGDTNNVFICYRFELSHYLDISTASDLNRRIQNDIRSVFGRMEGVDGRLDQTFKNPNAGVALFNSGPEWIVVPYDGGWDA